MAKYWRVKDGCIAAYDIYQGDRLLTTYEIDLRVQQPAGHSWADHVAEKQWASDKIVAELRRIEQRFEGKETYEQSRSDRPHGIW